MLPPRSPHRPRSQGRAGWIAAVAAVTALATGSVPAASANDQPSPGSAGPVLLMPPGATYQVSTGAPGANQYADDSPAMPFIDKDGTFHTQQSDSPYGLGAIGTWNFFTGTNLDDATKDAAVSDAADPNNPVDANDNTRWRCENSATGLAATIPPNSNTYDQSNYCDLIGMWVDPDTGNWDGLVHNEFTFAPYGQWDVGHLDGIDYAVSTDQGHTWKITGHAVTSPYATNRNDNTTFPNQTYYWGDGDQRLFADPVSGYFYLYYSSQIINKPGGPYDPVLALRDEHVARAPMSGKMAPGTWQKWYDGTWTEPGIGGRESNIVPVDATNSTGYTPVANDYNPANTGTISRQIVAGTLPPQSPLLYMSVTYDAYLGLYLAEANPENSYGTAHAEPLYVTDNLATQQWRKIGDTGSALYQDYWYHWFADAGNKTNPTIVGRTYREYCDYGCPSGGPEWRPVTIDSSNPATPIDPSLSYTITSGAGRVLAQTAGSAATTSVPSNKAGASAQWAFEPVDDGSYTITDTATGDLLGVDSSSTATRAWGTAPTATLASGTVGQQWFLVPSSSTPGFRLVNRYNGLALALSGVSGRLAETTPVRSWTDTTGDTVGGHRSPDEQTLTLTPAGSAPDLALGKPARAQSSDTGHNPAAAVDGKRSSYWSTASLPQWWQVDLRGVYNLSNIDITLTNDASGKSSYTYNIQASIDGSTWTTIASKTDAAAATKDGVSYPVTAVGRYLRVNMLSSSGDTGGRIDDFVVNGSPVLNLAVDKPATAQSSAPGAGPNLAVDPLASTSWAAGPLPQWWQVDLQGFYNLNTITLANLADGTRYYDYTIQASTDGTTWTTIAAKTDQATATSAGDVYGVNATARYLRVNMLYNSGDSGGYITNFVVNGSPAPNLALNMPATSQSFEPGHAPSLANDASTGSYWAAGPLPQWWQVDLQAEHHLTTVILTNYADGTRYYDYTIQASTDGTTWTTIATKTDQAIATPTGDSYPVDVTARYLRVNLTYNSANPSGHITDFAVYGS